MTGPRSDFPKIRKEKMDVQSELLKMNQQAMNDICHERDVIKHENKELKEKVKELEGMVEDREDWIDAGDEDAIFDAAYDNHRYEEWVSGSDIFEDMVNEKDEEIEKLEEEKKKLREDHVAGFKQVVQQLTDLNVEFADEITKLKEENERLRAEKSPLIHMKRLAEIETLKEENKKLTKENEELKTEIDDDYELCKECGGITFVAEEGCVACGWYAGVALSDHAEILRSPHLFIKD